MDNPEIPDRNIHWLHMALPSNRNAANHTKMYKGRMV